VDHTTCILSGKDAASRILRLYFRSKKSWISSNSAVFIFSSRMTVPSCLMSTTLVFSQSLSRCSKTEVLFLSSFSHLARHLLKNSLRTSGDLPIQESEISSSRKIRPYFYTLRNVSRRLAHAQRAVRRQQSDSSSETRAGKYINALVVEFSCKQMHRSNEK